MMFAAELAISTTGRTFGGVRRGEQRTNVTMPGKVGNDGIRSLCRVSDISRKGVRLATYSPLEVNSIVRLTLPGQRPIAARVVWADDYVAGCTFAKPLDEDVIETLVGIYGFEPADEIDLGPGS